MRLIALFMLASAVLAAQTPAELEKLLPTATEPGIVMLELALEYAKAGDGKRALTWYQKAVALNPEYDVEFDSDFRPFLATPGFRPLIERARKASPPVLNAKLAFTIAENDLIPEGLAYDPRSGKLYMGSINKRKIVEIAPDGAVRDFIKEGQDGIGSLIGMKVDRRTNTLWANSLSDTEGSGVYHFDLATGRMIKKYVVPKDLLFNDLDVSSKGNVYITASRTGALYWISAATDKLEEWRPGLKLRGANGIALSPDERRLFVANFPDGVTVIDLGSGKSWGLAHAENITLANIDGLYSYDHRLVAIQNGRMAHRVARFTLSPALDRVEKAEVLERGNPLFQIPTTGAVAGDTFYFIANSQLDNYGAKGVVDRAKLKPVSILKISLK